MCRQLTNVRVKDDCYAFVVLEVETLLFLYLLGLGEGVALH